MYSGDGKNRNHSGEGHAAINIITFVILFLILAAGFYATSFAQLHHAWSAWGPMLGVIAAGVITYGGAMVLSRRTQHHPDRVANEAAQQELVDTEYNNALKQSRH